MREALHAVARNDRATINFLITMSHRRQVPK